MNRRRKTAFASMVLLGTLNLQLDLVAVGTGVPEYTGFKIARPFHRSPKQTSTPFCKRTENRKEGRAAKRKPLRSETETTEAKEVI